MEKKKYIQPLLTLTPVMAEVVMTATSFKEGEQTDEFGAKGHTSHIDSSFFDEDEPKLYMSHKSSLWD